jgi:aspartate kinase
MIATSEVSMSLTVDDRRHLDEIREEIGQFAEVSVEDDNSIICLVGDNIRHTPGVAGRVFQALGDINVRMVSEGASRLNISLVVAAADAPRAMALLHEELFRDLDPAVFE